MARFPNSTPRASTVDPPLKVVSIDGRERTLRSFSVKYNLILTSMENLFVPATPPSILRKERHQQVDQV